jgi:hypothetical protein
LTHYNLMLTFSAENRDAARQLLEDWHLPEGSIIHSLTEAPQVLSARVGHDGHLDVIAEPEAVAAYQHAVTE